MAKWLVNLAHVPDRACTDPEGGRGSEPLWKITKI